MGDESDGLDVATNTYAVRLVSDREDQSNLDDVGDGTVCDGGHDRRG